MAIEICLMAVVWSIAVRWLRPVSPTNWGATSPVLVFMGLWIVPFVAVIGTALLASIWLDKKLHITELKRRIELAKPNICPKCGYTLVPGKTDDPWTWFCPECGATFDANGCDV